MSDTDRCSREELDRVIEWLLEVQNEQHAVLKEKYSYDIWGALPDDRTAIRFCTSWATPEESVDELVRDIAALN